MMSMSSFDLISMALRNLWKRKLRTFLTILGVIIGTTSIVVMISIGIGMNESYKEKAEQWGSLQVIDVYVPYESYQNGIVINSKVIEDFKNIKGVETATPRISEYYQIVCGKYMNDVEFIGIDPSTMEAMGYKVSEGRVLNEEDKNVIVVGNEVKNGFYNPKLSWRMR